MIRYFITQLLLLMSVLCPAQTPAQEGGTITVVIEPVYHDQPLVLTNQYYVNGTGDTLYIDLFKFYVTNLHFSSGINGSSDSNSHLIDAERTGSCTFDIKNVPAGNYTSLQFTMGVDSIANTSGANGGDLDPAKGMYWAWNTGYVMAKLEGRSGVCKALHHAFEFHVGGYMPPYNAARTVRLQLPQQVNVVAGKHAIVKIKADAAAWFRGINLAQTNSIVIPGKEASSMADNCALMFSVREVKNEQH